MNRETTLQVGQTTYVVVVDREKVTIKVTIEARPGDEKLGFLEQELEWGTAGENLVAAAKRVGMSAGDVTVVADRLGVVLPNGVAVPVCVV
jgi:hypothetical protein